MFPKPSYERPAPSIPPHSITFYLKEKIKVRQLGSSPSQELEAYRGKQAQGSSCIYIWNSRIQRSNLCWFHLWTSQLRQVHCPVPAARQHRAPGLLCDPSTCFLSLESQTPQRSCPQLCSRASWRIQEPSACSDPTGTCSPRRSDKNPKLE